MLYDLIIHYIKERKKDYDECNAYMSDDNIVFKHMNLESQQTFNYFFFFIILPFSHNDPIFLKLSILPHNLRIQIFER